MRFYNQFYRYSYLVLPSLHVTFRSGHVATFSWLRGCDGGLKFPAGTKNVALQMASSKRVAIGSLRALHGLRMFEPGRVITINELMQVPGPWVAEVKVFVP